MQTQWRNTVTAAMALVLWAAYGAMSPPALAAGEEPAGPPKAVFHQTKYEFGTIMEGQEIRHEFVVENKGQSVLTIERVQPD